MNAIEKIHSLDAFGSRPGLDRILRFLKMLGNPQDSLRFIHVAGTNGKGSTCRMLSSVLTNAGYKTGLFISPYIVDFRERIQINNEMISEEVLENAVERTFPLLEELRADDCIITEFEYVTALEFLIHKEAECDIVVLETGMGGLLDCTNVIKPPLCSVITTIGLDHTAVLGDTIEEIALQKCGIIKPGSVAVTSAQDERVMKTIENDCRTKGVNLIKSDDIKIDILNQSLGGTRFIYNENELFLPLAGEHQLENAKAALAALEVVKSDFTITPDNIKNGFAETTNPARLELLSENPTILLDGAHNPNGVEALRNALDLFLGGVPKILILGMLSDKDSSSSVRLLKGMFETVYTVPVSNPRTLTPEALAQKCEPFFKKTVPYENVFDAFDDALSEAKSKNATLIIAGSLYLAGEVRPYITAKI